METKFFSPDLRLYDLSSSLRWVKYALKIWGEREDHLSLKHSVKWYIIAAFKQNVIGYIKLDICISNIEKISRYAPHIRAVGVTNYS